MTPEQIDRVLEDLREAHPELRRPATWPTLRRMLRRIGVRVRLLPMAAEAKIVSMGGVTVIALSDRLHYSRHTYRLAHELGHLALHMNDGEPVFNMTPCWPDDPREDDAEYFATQLLGIHHPPRQSAGPADWPYGKFASRLEMELGRTARIPRKLRGC